MRRKGTRLILGGLVALGLAGAAAFAIAHSDGAEAVNPRPASERPALLLITTLPIIFPEEFTLDAKGSKALAALETRYKVVPIGATDARSLGQGKLLLMAHPLAQPAEDLVALDAWVRRGGRLLLLADPKLDWPSERPLGDKLRPPPSFADTGLLAHWGIRLAKGEIDGKVTAEVGPNLVVFSSPGELSSDGHCDIRHKELIAHCWIGHGKVTVIADADWLNDGMRSLPEDRMDNLGLLLSELDLLEH